MRLQKNIEKKSIILGIIIIAICLFPITQGEDSTNSDFSINIETDSLTLETGESSTILINLTANVSENVTLQGEWIGIQPQNISVNISTEIGIPPFLSNITFNTSNSERGNYVYRLTAEGINVDHSSDIKINVTYNHTLELQTDADNYSKGECIHIYGNVTTTPTENDVLSNNLSIILQQENWKRYATTSMQNSSFNYYYNISYGDPEGIWNITVTADDVFGNTIRSNKYNLGIS